MNVLVVQLGSFDQVLCTTPLLRCLSQQQNARLHCIIASEHEAILLNNPYIQQVSPAPHGIETGGPWTGTNWDAALLLADDAQHTQLAGQIKARRMLQPPNGLMHRVKKLLRPSQHWVHTYLHTATPLGTADDGRGLDLTIAKEDETAPADIPASHQLGFIAVQLPAHLKKETAALLLAFCRQVAHPVLFTGPQSVSATAALLTQPDPVKLYNACGKFSFWESADLLRRSRLVIGADPQHVQLAAALRKPLITLQVPSSSNSPYYGLATPAQKEWMALPPAQAKKGALLTAVDSFLRMGKLI